MLALLFYAEKALDLLNIFIMNHKRGSRCHDEIKFDEKSDEYDVQR
jgi:hypothetical protein